MTECLIVREAGPAVTVQDLGRVGYVAQGLTRGGAMDTLALFEAAALLDTSVNAAIEMIGMGGTFETTADIRIALTGAPMQVSVDGTAIAWNAAHVLPRGSILTIGGVRTGAIGYLSVGGGFDTPHVMGSQSAHPSAGLGRALQAGDRLTYNSPDPHRHAAVFLPQDTRFKGGPIRIVRSLQTHLYGDQLLTDFIATEFSRDPRANRQGIRMTPPDGKSFLAQDGLTVVSEIIAPGDIQVTGDGAPFILMREHQTTGGYPRIATVLPSDINRVAQTPLGARVSFELLDMNQARAHEANARAQQSRLNSLCKPLRRDPADIADLLSYTLVSGAISAWEDEG